MLIHIRAVVVGGVTITDTYTPSPFGEVDAYSAAVNGTTVYAYTIDQRDKLGRIVRKTETIEGVTTQYEYGYDPAGRLADVWRLSAPAAHLAHYDYDANGNRIGGFNQVSGVIEPASGLTDGTRYDDQDRFRQYETAVDGAVTYDYTANGELERKIDGSGETTYTYDAFGNLRTVVLPGGSTIEYLIDGRNRRIGKRVDGTFKYGLIYQDQFAPLAMLDSDGIVVAQFVFASKRQVPDYMIRYGENPGTFRIVSDHLGSPRMVIDMANASVVQRLDYDEFGATTLNTNPGLQPFGFAGGQADQGSSAGTDILRFGARVYDAQPGRFVQKDPIRFVGDTTNLFAYVFSDPINRTDRDGLRPGDRYGSPSEAAIDALEDVLWLSMDRNREYSGAIYRNADGTYSYTPGRGGDEASAPFVPVEGIVAGYHTHGDYGFEYGSRNDNFSPGDVELGETYAIDHTRAPATISPRRRGVRGVRSASSPMAELHPSVRVLRGLICRVDGERPAMRGESSTAASRRRRSAAALVLLCGLWATGRSEASRDDSPPVRSSNVSGVWEAVASLDEAAYYLGERVMIMLLEKGQGYLAVSDGREDVLVLEVRRLSDEGVGVAIDFADESRTNTARVLARGRLVGDSAYLRGSVTLRRARSTDVEGTPNLLEANETVSEWKATFHRRRGYISGLCDQARRAEIAIEARRSSGNRSTGTRCLRRGDRESGWLVWEARRWSRQTLNGSSGQPMTRHYEHGDSVRVVEVADPAFRPGAVASICGMRMPRSFRDDRGPNGDTILYVIEFADGSFCEIPGDLLEPLD